MSRKRIITCQGTIQLITALSVLSQREKEAEDSRIGYQNYLVIYDLNAPSGQAEVFSNFIQKMASLVLQWEEIIYLQAHQLSDIESKLSCSKPSHILNDVYQLIGLDKVDEIYLSRNWQFGNQLLINAYASAQKICYGDSIGLYFSGTSKAFFRDRSAGAVNPIKHAIQSLKQRAKKNFENIKIKLKGGTKLEIIPFDIGYFVLPDILGEVPPMPTLPVEPQTIMGILKNFESIVDRNIIEIFHGQTGDSPIDILLTSNFSEAERMSEENEIVAYREFLESSEIESSSVLVLKPHPRDGTDKIERIRESLADLYSHVLVLNDPSLFFLPFELFLSQALLAEDVMSEKRVRIFSVSSACLSLKLLFGIPSRIGFGVSIVEKRFYPDFAAGRLTHEEQLRAALNRILPSRKLVEA